MSVRVSKLGNLLGFFLRANGLILNEENQMNGVLGNDSALVRLCWAGDNLG